VGRCGSNYQNLDTRYWTKPTFLCVCVWHSVSCVCDARLCVGPPPVGDKWCVGRPLRGIVVAAGAGAALSWCE
jgi:hypothetical protein